MDAAHISWLAMVCDDVCAAFRPGSRTSDFKTKPEYGTELSQSRGRRGRLGEVNERRQHWLQMYVSCESLLEDKERPDQIHKLIRRAI